MTSPASISTQSQAGMPSTRAVPKPFVLQLLQTRSAMEPTWRCERPDAMIIVSASEVLPSEVDLDRLLGLHVVEAVEREGSEIVRSSGRRHRRSRWVSGVDRVGQRLGSSQSPWRHRRDRSGLYAISGTSGACLFNRRRRLDRPSWPGCAVDERVERGPCRKIQAGGGRVGEGAARPLPERAGAPGPAPRARPAPSG